MQKQMPSDSSGQDLVRGSSEHGVTDGSILTFCLKVAEFGDTVAGTGAACDQKTSKFFVLRGRIHDRTRGCKWNLLKARGGKYKREHDGAQVESGHRKNVLLFFRCF
jgi:hypothetical protein